MIKLSQVSKKYANGHQALHNVSFELKAAEMAFVLGPSGAGKTTLFKLLTHIEKPTSGQVLVQQKNLTRMSEHKISLLRREIGVVFQQPKLLYERSVFDNLALPLHVLGMPYNEIRQRVRAALGRVDLATREQALPITLSGGEQQRVSIARAVINRPNLLLADEPTGNLDETLADEIMALFTDFNRVGVTVLIATHDLRQVRRQQKRILQLRQGQLIHDGMLSKAI